jgi:hypothetical protein
MSRLRSRLLVVGVVAVAAAGCGTTPPAASPPPAATAAVGADGHPIRSLCDLLSPQDFARLAGVDAAAPRAGGSTATAADCSYGDRIRMTVRVLPDADLAATALRSQITAAAFASTEDRPIGGVDESVYGIDPHAATVLMRRRNLVVAITVPAEASDSKVKLIQLAAVVLTRANALGT